MLPVKLPENIKFKCQKEIHLDKSKRMEKYYY